MTEWLWSCVCSLESHSDEYKTVATMLCSSEITQVFLMSKKPESALLRTTSGEVEVVTFSTLYGTAELSKYRSEREKE